MNNLSKRLVDPLEDYLKEKQKQRGTTSNYSPFINAILQTKGTKNYFKDSGQ